MGRRSALEGVRLPQGKEPHRGLWLDKFLRSARREDTEAKRVLVREAAGIPEPGEYRAFFKRYRGALEALGAEIREARTLSRLVVGLGGEGVVLAFQFLQAHDVGIGLLQPRERVVEASLDGVHVPGGELHGAIRLFEFIGGR